MKFNFLKFKKKSLPSLKSLQPRVFDVDLFWFAGLGLCLVIIIITTLIGFNFFYSQYFESYKQSGPAENLNNLINTDRLRTAINKRNEFINKEFSLPKDPSL
jgi:hypothetical protein